MAAIKSQNAIWVEFPTMNASPTVRREFFAEQTRSAKIKISGLGLFALFINGVRVGSDVFAPAETDYHKRDLSQIFYPINDSFTHRVYYLEYDITELLTDGKNAIGVLLGNGWYNQHRRTNEGLMTYGFPRLFFEIDIEDERGNVTRIPSDTSLKWGWSFITSNNLFYGETQDMRLYHAEWAKVGFDDSVWENARPAPEYDFIFEKQEVEGDRVCRELAPTLIGDYGDRRIYDVGENISGFARVRLTGDYGDEVTLRFSEELKRDRAFNITEPKSLDFWTAGGGYEQVQTDRFISCGTECECEPYFTWHGFRYIELTGKGEIVSVKDVHTPIRQKASFTSSDSVLNWYFDSYVRTQSSNVHMAVPSDCPHRERLGYTGDGQVTADSSMTVFDGRALYKKWIRDILDCQDRESGHVQHTAPFMGGGGGPVGWGSAIITLPYMYYKHYRDRELLRECLEPIYRYIEYIKSRSDGALVTREEPYGWCLGEWCTPDAVKLPVDYVNSTLFVKALMRAEEMAENLGEEFRYKELITEVKRAITDKYFDTDTGSFLDGVQGADAFALDIGLGDSRTLKNLEKRYTDAREFDTGIFGTEILVRVLFENDLADIALDLLTSQSEHSFGRMMEYGATTLHEAWHAHITGGSHNHPMFGGAVASVFTYLVGVKCELSGNIKVSPVKQTRLKSFSASVETHRGRIRVKYENGKYDIEEEKI